MVGMKQLWNGYGGNGRMNNTWIKPERLKTEVPVEVTVEDHGKRLNQTLLLMNFK
jgi:hypothetical protein